MALPSQSSQLHNPAKSSARGLALGLGVSLVTTVSSASLGAEAESAVEEILVSSQRLEESIPLDLSRYGNRVEIISSEEIRQHGFVDISQTLQMLVPGLHIAPKHGPFDYFDASLQGSRNAEILWLVDGVRITNRLYNGTSPLDTLPAHMVERIEVLKGGQGIFYGTQSVGGVVNIVTKSLQNQTDGAVGTAINSNGGYNLNSYVRGAVGNHQFVLFASRDESDGYTPWREDAIQASATDLERGYEVDTLGLKYGFNLTPDSRLSLQYQASDAQLDFARPFLNRSTINDRDERIFTAKYDLRVNDNVELFIKAYRHDWDTLYTRLYNSLDEAGQLDGGVVVRNDGDYWGYEDSGANAMAKFNFGGNFEYILGLDHQRFSGTDDVWRIGDLEEEVTAPFVQLRTTEELFDNTLLALGLRHNRASNVEDSTVWNLTGKHYFTERFYFQGNVGTSFRLPDAEALFLNEFYDEDNDGVPDGGWFAIGNPNLKPEESENLNLALGGDLGALSYELTWFSRDITNYIDSYVPLTIGGVVGESFVNSDDEVNMDGFELIAGIAVNESWSASLSHTLTDATFNGSGPQLGSIPESESKLRLNYNSSALPLGLSLSGNYVGDINGRRGQTRGDYTVVDLAGYYHFGAQQQHQFVLRLENILDEDYATRIDVGTLDLSGDSYLYENLGMGRTSHLSYTYQF